MLDKIVSNKKSLPREGDKKSEGIQQELKQKAEAKKARKAARLARQLPIVEEKDEG